MQTAELTSKLADLKAELFNLRFQHAINQMCIRDRVTPLPSTTAASMCLCM